MDDDFLNDITSILNSARQGAKTAVNSAMVYAYYEIGRLIYEKEQQIMRKTHLWCAKNKHRYAIILSLYST